MSIWLNNLDDGPRGKFTPKNTEKYIFICPEYNGSIPGVLKSVIDCSDVPFNREFANDAALYFDLNNENSLVQVLLELINGKKLRENLGKRAHSYAKKNNSEIDKTASFFQKIINE